MKRDELQRIGESLYGDQWQTALARAIGISDRQMRRLATGSPMTRPVEIAIRCLKDHGRRIGVRRMIIYANNSIGLNGKFPELIVRQEQEGTRVYRVSTGERILLPNNRYSLVTDQPDKPGVCGLAAFERHLTEALEQ